MPVSETRARVLLCAACLLSLCGFLACPSPPNPGPTGPGGTDGSVPVSVSCAEACQNAQGACQTFDSDLCKARCPNFSTAFRAHLAAAKNCDDVKVADPGAPASAATRKSPQVPAGR